MAVDIAGGGTGEKREVEDGECHGHLRISFTARIDVSSSSGTN